MTKGENVAKTTSGGRKTKSKPSAARAKTKESPVSEPIEDAVEVVETKATAAIDASESPLPETGESVVMTDPQLANEGEPEAATEETPAKNATPIAEDTPAKAPDPAPTPMAPPPANSTFFPLVLGGLLAGFIGYGVAYLQYANQATDDTPFTSAELDRIAAAEAQISQAEAEIANLPAPVDLSGVEGQIAGLGDAMTQIGDTVTGIDERLSVVERQPSGDGTLQEAAIAAYQADIDALRAQIEDQQTNLQAMADAAANQLDETRAEAQSIEQNAVEAARAATSRAALARVQASLESGAPIGATLAELGDTLDAPVPDALTAVTDGAPTLASLQESFPDAARLALATARSEGADGESSGGLGAFMRSQFEVRSVVPREGPGVDPTLSRAEAALKQGRLSDALAEVATLPEVARAALSDWTAQAELRAAAIDAADTLATSLNAN